MAVMNAIPTPTGLPVASTHHLEVLAVADIGPRIRRVTVGGPGLVDFEPLPGQDVVVHLTDEHGDGVRRRYTIRHLDRVNSAFDLDVVVHGHGAGSTWGTTARPGDKIEIFGPRGKVLLSGARWQLFIGDESALPAVAELIAALPADTEVHALLEIEQAVDEQPIATGTSGADVRWLYRGSAPAGAPELFEEQLKTIEFPPEDRHFYVFGESRMVRRLRDEMIGRQVRSDEISAKGYWNLGRVSNVRAGQ